MGIPNKFGVFGTGMVVLFLSGSVIFDKFEVCSTFRNRKYVFSVFPKIFVLFLLFFFSMITLCHNKKKVLSKKRVEPILVVRGLGFSPIS